VIVLSTVLRIKRTLDGAEIDKIIWDIEAREALAIERVSAWPTGALARPAFARCDHFGAAAVPRSAPDLCGNR
jgi:hypothetical protein